MLLSLSLLPIAGSIGGIVVFNSPIATAAVAAGSVIWLLRRIVAGGGANAAAGADFGTGSVVWLLRIVADATHASIVAGFGTAAL